MTDIYAHLDYEDYKRFEAACKEFPERKHSGGSDYYHASIRLPLGKGLTLEVNGPAVKVPPTGPTEITEIWEKYMGMDRVVALEAALRWCSGSSDFAPGGQAREGWLKVCAPLLGKGEESWRPPGREQP
ncbi:hypothetical protein LCGC14_2026160 [marine sediment metagenome]|uniref:Uncharacterized protein n=1 Tax=marine sediment metagenome TaxID=412755 RepID=A0A0F9FIP1_9ZZZZ